MLKVKFINILNNWTDDMQLDDLEELDYGMVPRVFYLMHESLEISHNLASTICLLVDKT